MVDYPDIRKAIRAGELDDFLVEITSHAVTRQKQLAAEAARSIESGSTIVIAASCKPKMLAGAWVDYVSSDNIAGRVSIRLRQTYSAKWRKGNVVRIPVTLVGEVIPPVK